MTISRRSRRFPVVSGRDIGTLVREIREMADQIRSAPDATLAHQIHRLVEKRSTGSAGTIEAEILIPCFAACYEAVRRTLGLELFDVQLMAGVALAHGSVAEMQTGEGKTVAAVAPACLRAIMGDSVHVATVNDYLATRDFQQLRPVYEMLGLRAGLLRAGASTVEKQHAYHCDITYGPGYEFGFDYLRDQSARLALPPLPLARRFRQTLHGATPRDVVTCQARRDFSIIDEIDSVLIDEAHVPLVLSGGAGDVASQSEAVAFRLAHDLATELQLGTDFTLKDRRCRLTPRGGELSQGRWRVSAAMKLQRAWHSYVENALQARNVLRRDVDYVVVNDEIHIVDPNTGRIFPDRSWRDGLHQAVQTKEGVTIHSESTSIAQISRQRFYQLYRQIAGMTGTAYGAEHEFRAIYGLPVLRVPLRQTSRRRVLPTRCFVDRKAKWDAIVQEIAIRHWTGQPVLVGTRNIANGESLAERLTRYRIPHRLLNGKQDLDEAEIVGAAGEQGAVTVATNMAGRGTDIRLGAGRPRQLGLHVIGEECNDLTRIDRQLIGRAARQGDPGSSQFFVSSDDVLLEQHGPSLQRAIRRRGSRSHAEIRLDLSRAIESIQKRVERKNYLARRDLMRRDQWMETVLDRLAERIA